MNKRCTNPSCRKTFSTLNADGKCPFCGKSYPQPMKGKAAAMNKEETTGNKERKSKEETIGKAQRQEVDPITLKALTLQMDGKPLILNLDPIRDVIGVARRTPEKLQFEGTDEPCPLMEILITLNILDMFKEMDYGMSTTDATLFFKALKEGHLPCLNWQTTGKRDDNGHREIIPKP